MKIEYDAEDDILYLRFSEMQVMRDVSHGWNINVGYSQDGIAEITIPDAKAKGYWPLENAKDLLPLTA